MSLAARFLQETGSHLEDADCEACGEGISEAPVVQRGRLNQNLFAVHVQCADVFEVIEV